MQTHQILQEWAKYPEPEWITSACILRGSEWHRSRERTEIEAPWPAQLKKVITKATKLFCYAETGRRNSTENTNSLSRSSLYYPGKQWGDIAQIKQKHRYNEIENEILMQRRKVSDNDVQRSQIKPCQAKQKHIMQACVNPVIMYPGSSQFRQSMHE